MSQKTYAWDTPPDSRKLSGGTLWKSGRGTIFWCRGLFKFRRIFMKNKKILWGLVALIVAIAVFAGIYMVTRPDTAEGAKTITVTVVHADGTVRDFVCHTDEEYLGPVLLAENIASGKDEGYGLMILVADGESAIWEENQAYWALYIGEEYASTGADTTPVNDGDVFKLVYTIG